MVHFDNANVCDTSISWYEADKEQVITATSFCPIGNTAGLLSEVHMNVTAMRKQTIKMDKRFSLLACLEIECSLQN